MCRLLKMWSIEEHYYLLYELQICKRKLTMTPHMLFSRVPQPLKNVFNVLFFFVSVLYNHSQKRLLLPIHLLKTFKIYFRFFYKWRLLYTQTYVRIQTDTHTQFSSLCFSFFLRKRESTVHWLLHFALAARWRQLLTALWQLRWMGEAYQAWQAGPPLWLGG